MLVRAIIAALLLIASATAPVAGEVPRELTWDSLVPPPQQMDSPSAPLTTEQRQALDLLAYFRLLKKHGLESKVAGLEEQTAELTSLLEAEGLDVESLLERYATINSAVEKQSRGMVAELEGQLVRLPGYALPVEFSEGGVTEFFLVPYVGACIHVPPPPPNQMVFVQLDEEFTVDGLYTPVWITGRMSVGETTKSLSYVDGERDVSVGYTMTGLTVEPYVDYGN